MGATAELKLAIHTRLTSGESYYDLLVRLGNAIGRSSLPSMTFKVAEEPPETPLSATLRRTIAFGEPGFKNQGHSHS